MKQNFQRNIQSWMNILVDTSDAMLHLMVECGNIKSQSAGLTRSRKSVAYTDFYQSPIKPEGKKPLWTPGSAVLKDSRISLSEPNWCNVAPRKNPIKN
jgi:hypothetical protein